MERGVSLYDPKSQQSIDYQHIPISHSLLLKRAKGWKRGKGKGKREGAKHTNHKPGKKRINPTHNQRLRHHHGHIPLHHAHHALHRRRIRHRVWRRFPSASWIFQEAPFFVGRYHVVFPSGEGGGGDGVGVVAEVDAAEERALFADGGEVEFFGGAG